MYTASKDSDTVLGKLGMGGEREFQKMRFLCPCWWPEVLQVLQFLTNTLAGFFPLLNKPLMLRRAFVPRRPNKTEMAGGHC